MVTLNAIYQLNHLSASDETLSRTLGSLANLSQVSWFASPHARPRSLEPSVISWMPMEALWTYEDLASWGLFKQESSVRIRRVSSFTCCTRLLHRIARQHSLTCPDGAHHQTEARLP